MLSLLKFSEFIEKDEYTLTMQKPGPFSSRLFFTLLLYVNLFCLIFCLCCFAAAYMPFCLIFLEYYPYLVHKCRIYFFQPFGYVLVDSALAYSKLFSGVSYCCPFVDDIICKFQDPLFYVLLQPYTPLLIRHYSLHRRYIIL